MAGGIAASIKQKQIDPPSSYRLLARASCRNNSSPRDITKLKTHISCSIDYDLPNVNCHLTTVISQHSLYPLPTVICQRSLPVNSLNHANYWRHFIDVNHQPAEGSGTAITDINGTVFNPDQVALDLKIAEFAAWIAYELS